MLSLLFTDNLPSVDIYNIWDFYYVVGSVPKVDKQYLVPKVVFVVFQFLRYRDIKITLILKELVPKYEHNYVLGLGMWSDLALTLTHNYPYMQL